MPDLPDPPEFDADGSPPPLWSADVLVAEGYYLTGKGSAGPALRELGRTTTPAPEFAAAQVWMRSAGIVPGAVRRLVNPAGSSGSVAMTAGATGAGLGVAAAVLGVAAAPATLAVAAVVAGSVGVEAIRRWASKPATASQADPRVLRRITCTKRWRRNEDQIARVAPGMSSTVTTEVTVGLSTATTKELSASLGAQGTVGPAQLSAQLASRIGRTVTVTEQRKETRSTAVSNDRVGFYRRVILWYPEHTVRVAVLEADEDGLYWRDDAVVTFAGPADATSTYADVPKT